MSFLFKDTRVEYLAREIVELEKRTRDLEKSMAKFKAKERDRFTAFLDEYTKTRLVQVMAQDHTIKAIATAELKKKIKKVLDLEKKEELYDTVNDV